jgi:hypothetical protein
MRAHLRRTCTWLVGTLVLVGSTVALAPSASASTCTVGSASRPCTIWTKSPTAGVKCTEQRWTTLDGGNGYRGKCTGTPTGISRGYKYREEIKCDYDGSTAWVYAPWKSDGSWSTPGHMCPDNDAALSHTLHFAWV